MEQGGIQLCRSGFDYVWNGWYIYLKVRTSGMYGSYKTKNDRENLKRGYEGKIEGPYMIE